MSVLEIITSLVTGAVGAAGWIRFTAYRAKVEQGNVTAPPPPPTPHNELQRALYEPEDAPRPVARQVPPQPTKRGPGRPRKAPDTTQYVGGGKRSTRTWAEPAEAAKKQDRRKIN